MVKLHTLVFRGCTVMYTFPLGSEYISGSPFGSNYQLAILSLSCGVGATNVSECRIRNQTSSCDHRATIGVVCKGMSE